MAYWCAPASVSISLASIAAFVDTHGEDGAAALPLVTDDTTLAIVRIPLSSLLHPPASNVHTILAVCARPRGCGCRLLVGGKAKSQDVDFGAVRVQSWRGERRLDGRSKSGKRLQHPTPPPPISTIRLPSPAPVTWSSFACRITPEHSSCLYRNLRTDQCNVQRVDAPFDTRHAEKYTISFISSQIMPKNHCESFGKIAWLSSIVCFIFQPGPRTNSRPASRL